MNYALMAEKGLINLKDFKFGLELMSNHRPLSVITDKPTKECT